MTRPVTVTIPHELGVAEARRRIDGGFARLERQVGSGLGQIHKSWDGDRMSFAAKLMGQAVSGRLDVRDTAVMMEIDLPIMLALIADQIKGRVQHEGRLLLEKK